MCIDTPAVHSAVFGEDLIGWLIQAAPPVSIACTKLVVLFSSSTPSPEDCSTACREVEQSSLLLVAALSSMGPRDGKTFLEECRSHVFNVLGDLEKLITTVMSDGCTRWALSSIAWIA